MKILRFLQAFSEDLLIIGGLLVMILTTYQINWVIGNYALGFILVGMGLVIAKGVDRK